MGLLFGGDLILTEGFGLVLFDGQKLFDLGQESIHGLKGVVLFHSLTLIYKL